MALQDAPKCGTQQEREQQRSEITKIHERQYYLEMREEWATVLQSNGLQHEDWGAVSTQEAQAIRQVLGPEELEAEENSHEVESHHPPPPPPEFTPAGVAAQPMSRGVSHLSQQSYQTDSSYSSFSSDQNYYAAPSLSSRSQNTSSACYAFVDPRQFTNDDPDEYQNSFSSSKSHARAVGSESTPSANAAPSSTTKPKKGSALGGKRHATVVEEVPDEADGPWNRSPSNVLAPDSRIIMEPKPSKPPSMYEDIIQLGADAENIRNPPPTTNKRGGGGKGANQGEEVFDQEWFQRAAMQLRQGTEQRNRNRRFQQRSLPGAELHSPERFPPPRCHPGTRMELKEEIHTWLVNEDREQDMLWLFGPAGVGKSAIAQTVGELAEELGIFGAALFFSRGRNVDNPSLFVTSIAYQLTGRHSSYGNKVVDVIRKEPTILGNVDKRAQLRKLLIEPFANLGRSSKQLIIIDGLDECGGEIEQSELVRLIADAVDVFDSPPFLWLICSRPEHHLKELFLDEDLSKICWRRELLPQEPGADADVETFLIDGLQRITERFHDQHCADSVSSLAKETLSRLVRTVSGVFIVASSMLAFIGDPIIAKPASQLQIVLDAIDGSKDGSGQNFLAAIDALYLGVLRAAEKRYLPQTLRILGTCAVSPRMPALHLANFLGITQETFYSSLRSLHAFLSVPHHTTAAQESLHFFHASFPDFLLHRSRSGEYFQDSDIHRFKLVEVCLHALDSTSTAYSSNLSWLPPDPGLDEDDSILSESPLSVSHDILSLAATHAWDLCTRISKPQEREPLLKIVANFDFGRLQPFCDVLPVRPFIHFIRWMHTLGKESPDLMHVIRTRCWSNVDVLLLEKCITISQPLNLESAEEINELEESPRYIFAGLRAKAMVILLIPEAVMIYSMKDIEDM